MSTRVLSTATAKESIAQVRSIIDGGLTTQITQLKSRGQTLSDPNVWDGRLAQRFRGELWPQTEQALQRMIEALTQLQGQVDQITTNIMDAGN
jgi:uncharacterized protein YukE